jgi:transcriptional regulator with XRE-family HTH domain
MADAHPFLVGLGRAVRELRSEQGLSAEALSLRSGVHRNYIGGIERGERQPSVLVIVRLAEALGVDPGDLFTAAQRQAR